ncbi:serine/threonine-protein kinase [Nostoc sp. 'Peltigera membranacea cyanobiont' 232]|uniref:serine/threonine-protein kinase n=1 Tax=Nostoc sp. 'Peltigera membranacea cyanobiont' 232 TaxID=2014531 RepID=UPI000B951B20|nr:serine/threonine-protein kinase [Nostoc sp. 'Peltigera membranacea cyanobiont' 232]OYE03659.1 serine/threonine protein kinase [Nostoc sp. 'Peltigera membranacea cyanobiont' 232]
MTNHIIGKLLQGRYQIVQTLGAGVFGQTYIAVDVDYPENPKCVVKQIKVNSCEPGYLEMLRLMFLTETETLKLLGSHPQIPEFIACFEENNQFYLVQELIEGHALTAELPIDQQWGCLWSEKEVVEFLIDVLGILEFVHSQGVIHCDIKPENLIRRNSDALRKLVLIDFGSIQSIDFGIGAELPIYRIPVTSLGYIPPEQFIGQTQPNSDIYALGMIAIQALTGLEPLQLKVDPYTNEIFWRSQNTPVNDYLAAVLSQMIRYDSQNRFQSAAEVLQVLKQMTWETQPSETLEADNQFFLEAAIEDDNPTSGNLSPLFTGMKIGLAANSLLMGFGVYSLINTSPAYSETETLSKATQEYQAGDLQEAIALAKSIPSHSNVYPEAQATIEEWQEQWQVAAQQYQMAQLAFHESRWSDVLDAVSQIPNISYWQSKTDKLVQQAYINIEAQTQDLLAKAYESAQIKDFSSALQYLRQIPKESRAGALVQEKLAEYNRKRQIRAAYFLQNAYKKASIGDFDRAVKFLRNIPQDTLVYAQAQVKLNEYTQKQRLLADNQKVASAKRTNSFVSKKSANKIEYLQVGNYLQEVNIR